jgi:hypothetical protein
MLKERVVFIYGVGWRTVCGEDADEKTDSARIEDMIHGYQALCAEIVAIGALMKKINDIRSD